MTEQRQLKAQALCVIAVLENLGEPYTEILCHMSCAEAGSVMTADEAVAGCMTGAEREAAASALSTMVRLGLVAKHRTRGESAVENLYRVPVVVRMVARHLMVDDGGAMNTFYVWDMMVKVKDLSLWYESLVCS